MCCGTGCTSSARRDAQRGATGVWRGVRPATAPVIQIGDPKRYRREWLAAQRSLAAVFPEIAARHRARTRPQPAGRDRGSRRPDHPGREARRALAGRGVDAVSSASPPGTIRVQDNERKALAAALTAIDPGRRPLTVLDDGEFLASPAPGDLVNVHETWAGDGIFRAVASARGVPPPGTFATIADTTMYVELPPVRGNGRGPRRNDPLIQLD